MKEVTKKIVKAWLVNSNQEVNDLRVEHIVEVLNKGLLIIEQNYHITCHWDKLDGYEQKIGNRVCLIYDKEHYFIMRIAEPDSGKVFAPHVDRESALLTFNELENNEDIQLEND